MTTFRKTPAAAAAIACLVGAPAAPTLAQTTERVEITGSAIRRIDAEVSLPVQVLKRSDIERTGATSTVDLLQRLTVVQGATHEASNVGGNSVRLLGGCRSTASARRARWCCSMAAAWRNSAARR